MAYFSTRDGGGLPDDESFEKMRKFIGPGQVESTIRQAISMCWMSLTPEKKNIDEVESQIRRIMDRIFRSMREDEDAFGGGSV